MLRRITGQLLAGIGVVAAVLTVAAPPAVAAKEVVAVSMRDVTVAAGQPGVLAGVVLVSDVPAVLHNVLVTYDFRDLDGAAEVVPPDGARCVRVKDTAVTCSRDEVRIGPAPVNGQFDAVVRAVAGATGGEGTIEIGLTADEIEQATASSYVRVGEGVDLVAGPAVRLSRGPGQTFALPLQVDVAGSTPVDHPTVYFSDTYAFRAARKFTNCTYFDDRVHKCSFDGTFAAGDDYSAVMPFTLGADTSAPGTKSMEATWMTLAEAQDYETFLGRHGYGGGEPGTEGELPLTAVPSLRAEAQADTAPANNHTSVSVAVTGNHAGDLAAVGAAFRAPVGAVRTIRIGVRNAGPAALEHSGGDVTLVDVTVPRGTTAVDVPIDCAPLVDGTVDPFQAGQSGAAAYRCRPGPVVQPGWSIEFPFQLRVDRARPADGAVRIDGVADLNGSNDRAAIRVNRDDPAPPPASAGDSLPITGAPAGTLAGLGLLLIVAGAGAVVLARRRRATT